MVVLVWARARRGVAAGLALLALSACASSARTGREATVSVQLLAFNDLHGHLSANTPGSIQTGCCDAVRDRSGTQVGWAPKTVLAGGVEYFVAHLASLRLGKPYSFTVAGGDLVGGSPLASALFHDEPTIEAMRALRLDVSSVGNHEFDHGLAELLRLQDGRRASFQHLAANVFYAGIDRTTLPASTVRAVGSRKIAFIGLTLRDTPSIVTPSGVAGLEFRSEVDTANAVTARLQREEGVNAFVVLVHQGGRQTPPAPTFPGPADQPTAYADINGCARFNGPEVDAIARGLDARVKVVVTAHSHEPYVCTIAGKLVTSAASFGRVVTDIELQVNRRTGEIESASARNHIVSQDVNRDPGAAGILAKYVAAMAPRARRVVGRITADILSARETPSGLNAAGEQPMGDVVADAMLEAAAVEGGGAVAALTNAGGDPRRTVVWTGNGRRTSW